MSILNRLRALGICTDAFMHDFTESAPAVKMQLHEARRLVAEHTGVKLLGLPSLQSWSDLLDVVFPVLDETPELAVAFLVLAPEDADALLLTTLRDIECESALLPPANTNTSSEPSGFAALGSY